VGEKEKVQEYDCESWDRAHYFKAMSAEQDEVRFRVPECFQGDSERVATLRKEYHSLLLSTLIARGATLMEAEDLLADLWGDCIGRQDTDGSGLLHKFSGKCPIQNWLITVATNRLLDWKRRQRHRGELPHREEEGSRERSPHHAFEQLPAPCSPQSETGLVELLKGSLQAALAQCSPQAMLMLRLVYLNGLSQREVGRMWGWHESKVSRCVTQAMADIEDRTLREIKERDPWLELAWADFLVLCESNQIGFL